MTDLNLSGQSTLASAIQTRVNQLKAAMDERLPVWRKLPIEKKKKWVTSGKDPIMTLAWNIYKYLRNNFFDSGVDDQ
jgi:hypothetical protein